MPPSKGPFSANIHPITLKLSVPIPEGMCFRKMVGGPPSKMNGSGPKIRLKSPLAPQPVPQKLASMPPSKGPFSANIHPITLKLSVPISEGMCFRKMVGGPLRKWTDRGQKSVWNHLSTPAGTQKLASMPPSKGPFSANMHPITLKLSVPIPEGMCFRKMVGGPLRKWTDRGQKSTSNHHKDSSRLLTNPLKINFPDVISPRICIWSFPTLLCV